MTRFSTTAILLCLGASPALAQASIDVQAGNLRANAQAGTSDSHPERDKQIARGPRTDDTRNCEARGVSVQNGNSSASASVSTSPGGSSVVAGGGSPGSHAEFFGCNAPTDRSTR